MRLVSRALANPLVLIGNVKLIAGIKNAWIYALILQFRIIGMVPDNGVVKKAILGGDLGEIVPLPESAYLKVIVYALD